MSHCGLYADPGGGAQLGLRQYFQQKSCPGDPPANHIAGERIDPGAAVYVCLVAGSMARCSSCWRVYARSICWTVLSLLYLAFIATLVGYGIWGSLLGRYETWRVAPLSLLVPVVGMASAALLLGETLSGLQLAGAALDHGRALYQRFRSASGAAWHGARVKKSPGDGAIHKYACNGITGRAAGSTARQVRQIYHCRPPYD